MVRIDDRINLQYVSAGLFSTSQQWIHPRRIIDSYEIIYVTRGNVHIEEDGVEYSLKSGDVLLLRPGVLHTGSRMSEGEVEFFWVHFITDDIDYFCLDKVTSARGEYITLNLFRGLLHIANTVSMPEYARDLSCGSIIAHLASMGNGKEAASTTVFSKISEWVRMNIRQNMKVRDIAEMFGYNKTYISRLFKKHSGLTLKDYIDKERINCAKELLLTTDTSVKDIAYELGFGDENLFVKFFKYHEKMSPTNFRNMYFKIHMNNK
ncbi:MAG: AraC family transcriptional regulator [Oscillospiraceae bacterium]|nr:AraC family transcriptional regulator [Oscillospiraceae bacterium]MBQ4545116.1 AraC family transcriptional regulator [Oscillospiraceae bacterium]MBQ6901597.1 AraC family transcriptional regulator [Oscillospiraceae bacterium]